MHPLDNVIWQALATRQEQFAKFDGSARHFPREVTSLGGFREADDEGYECMGRLLGGGGAIGIFLRQPYEPRKGWEYVGGAPLLQMIHGGVIAEAAPRSSQNVQFTTLGDEDSPEMVELTALTKPGPFGKRTHELGTYLGIRIDGKLVAMAGERLKVPGHSEISAVCTHPEYLGRGFAGLLMTELMQRIRERGETPFLHSRADNARAISLYERLGFRDRSRGHYAVIRRVNG
jgi:ribosomal protein S18 acetylase RimI-like enzyme